MLKRVVQGVLEAAFVGYIVYYVIHHRGEIARLWNVRLVDAAAVIALILAGTFVRAWNLQYILRILKARMTLAESWHLITATTLLNYLPMNAGTLIKARVLKKHAALKYAHFVAMMGALALISLLVGSVMGVAALAVSPEGPGRRTWPAILFLVAVCLGLLLVLHLPALRVGSGGGWLRRALRDILEGWEEMRRHRGGLLVLCGTGALMLLSHGARFCICLNALGTPVSLIDGVLFAVVTSLLLIVSITPGSLGVREVLFGALLAVTGSSFERGMFAASLDRVLALAAAMATGFPSLVVLKRRKIL